MFCKFCGTQMNDGDLFCPNCGKKQTNESRNASSASHISTPQQISSTTQTAQPQTQTQAKQQQHQSMPITTKNKFDIKVFIFVAIGICVYIFMLKVVVIGRFISNIINTFVPHPYYISSIFWHFLLALFFCPYMVICMVANKYEFKQGAMISLGFILTRLVYILIYAISYDSYNYMSIIHDICGFLSFSITLLSIAFITSKIIARKNTIAS